MFGRVLLCFFFCFLFSSGTLTCASFSILQLIFIASVATVAAAVAIAVASSEHNTARLLQNIGNIFLIRKANSVIGHWYYYGQPKKRRSELRIVVE